MASLADCIKKAGKALNKRDADAIVKMAERDGVSERDAVEHHIAGIFVPAPAEDFAFAMRQSLAANKNAAAVHQWSVDEFEEMDTHLADNGKVGFAIYPGGEIVAIFASPDKTQVRAMDAIMLHAIESGGFKLNAFDGWLVEKYKSYGFVETKRTPWDEGQRPPGWSSDRGTPDVVDMVLEKDGTAFKEFFARVTMGLEGVPSLDAVYRPEVPRLASELGNRNSTFGKYDREFNSHKGKFDDHIAFSIPGYRDFQFIIGNAIVETFGEGNTMLDIGASEGSQAKTITKLSGMKTVSLDPNVAMRNSFRRISKVPGASFSMTALNVHPEQKGVAWKDGKHDIKYFNDQGRKFDVVQESMVFQFMDSNRAAHIKRMAELTKEDGVAIIQEKVFTDKWKENETKKNTEYKAKYFTAADLDAKSAQVLEGMNQNMVWQAELENIIAENFKYYWQIWDSGNFKGYGASNSAATMNKFRSNTVDTRTDFDTRPTAEPNTVTRSDDPITFYQAQVNGIGMYSTTEQAIVDMKLPQWKKKKGDPLSEEERALWNDIDANPFKSTADPRYQKAKPIYAKLRKHEGLASGSEVWAKLKKSPGVKQEELDWVGVEDWLKSEGKVTRDEVVEFIRDNGVHIEEIVSGQGEDSDNSFNWTETVDDDPANWLDRGSDYQDEVNDALKNGQYTSTDDFDHPSIGVPWLTADIARGLIDEYIVDKPFDEWSDESQAAKLALDELKKEGVQASTTPALIERAQWKFDKSILNDLSDKIEEMAEGVARDEYMERPYRQWVDRDAGMEIHGNDDDGYTFRSMSSDWSGSDIRSFNEAEIQAMDHAREEGHPIADAGGARWGDYVTEGSHDNYREIKLTLPDLGGEKFTKGEHFDEPNIVAFLRVTDRNLYDETSDTPDRLAGKTYFIDEMQSDWHQEGRQVGYKLGVDANELDKKRDDLLDENTKSLSDVFDQEVETRTEADPSTTVYEPSFFRSNKGVEVLIGPDNAGDNYTMRYGTYYTIAEELIINGMVIPSENFRKHKVLLNVVHDILTRASDNGLIDLDKMKSNYAEADTIEKRATAERIGVPNAPFKGDAWTNLALKRAVVDAVENGYESIAFPNAEVLVDRWSETYRTLYETQYNMKMPSALKKITGEKPLHLTMDDGEQVRLIPKVKPKDINLSDWVLTEESHPTGDMWVYTNEQLDEFKAFYKDEYPDADDAKEKLRDALAKRMNNNPRSRLPKGFTVRRVGDTQMVDVFTGENTSKDTLYALFDADGNRVFDDGTDDHIFADYDQPVRDYNRINYPHHSEQGYWAIPITDELRGRVKAGLPLFQGEKDRGSISLTDVGERIIRLGKSSDPSTFLHETAHLFLELEKQFAIENGTTDQQREMLNWLGVGDWNQITREHHEKYAETFEVYLETGEAPSSALRQAFASFRRWLTAVYKLFDNRQRADLTPEIKDYFDRLLASEAEIEALTADPAYDQFFKSAEQAGMTDAQWEKYLKQRENAKNKSQSTLDEQVIRELKKRKTKEWKEEKAPLIREEKERLSKLPAYQILSDIKTAPMDFGAIVEIHGKLPGNMTGKAVKEGGIHPDEYATVYNYPSADAMLKDIANTPALSKAANDAAEQRMIEKYGDILNDGTIEQEARDAVHNDEQAKLLLIELKALGKKLNTGQHINREYLKAEAIKLIESMKYSQLRPSKYYHAEIRAAKTAATATNDQEAYEAKVQQIANHYLYRLSVDVKARMEKHRKYVRKVQTRKYSDKDVHPAYISKLKMVANLYDLRTNPERVQTVSDIIDWYSAQLESKIADISLIDHNVLKAMSAKVKSPDNTIPQDFPLPTFNDLTAEELHSLVDQLKHLRFMGGQLSDEVANERAIIRAESTQSIIDNGGKDQRGVRGIPGARENESRRFSHLINKLPSLMNMVRKLDGFTAEGQGVMFNNLYQLVVEGNNAKIALKAELYEKFKAELNNLVDIGLSRNDSKVYQLENGGTLPIHSESRFVMALYWGVESSRDAIMEGFGMTEKDVMNVLSDMTDAQLDLVEAVWSLNEEVWPMLAKAGVARFGVAPPKLDNAPFTINGRTLKGGHLRLFYDSTRLELKSEQEAQGSSMEIAPTKAGSLHARVGSGGLPPLLDVTNITRALDESIHYIAFAEVSNEIRALINATDVKAAIERKHGVGFYKALIESIDSVTGDRHAKEANPQVAAWMRHLRKSVSYQYIVLNVRNVMDQTSALPIAIAEVGGMDFANAATRITTDPNLIEFIKERSPFMHERASVVNKTASDYMHKLAAGELVIPVPFKEGGVTMPSKVTKAYRFLEEHGYVMQTGIDALMAYPVWLARYEQAMKAFNDGNPNASEAETNKAVKTAITLADTAVSESVGSGDDIHLGGLYQSSQSELLQFVTMMGSWFNNQYQRIYRDTKGFSKGGLVSAKAAQTIVLVPFISAIMSAAIRMDGPDEDEEMWMWAAKQYGGFLAAMVPFVRDIYAANVDSRPVTSVWSGAVKVPGRAVKEISAYAEGRQTGLKTTSDMLKVTATLTPLPGAGNITRVMDYIDSYNRGEEDRNAPLPLQIHQALVEGADKNR